MFPFTPHTTLRLNFVRAVPYFKGLLSRPKRGRDRSRPLTLKSV